MSDKLIFADMDLASAFAEHLIDEFERSVVALTTSIVLSTGAQDKCMVRVDATKRRLLLAVTTPDVMEEGDE